MDHIVFTEQFELTFPVDFLKQLVNTVPSSYASGVTWSGSVEHGECFDGNFSEKHRKQEGVTIKTAVCGDGSINISFAQLNLIILKRCCSLKLNSVDKQSGQVNDEENGQLNSSTCITTPNSPADQGKAPISRRGRKRGKTTGGSRKTVETVTLTEPRKTRSASHSQGIPKHLLYPGENDNRDHAPDNSEVNDAPAKENSEGKEYVIVQGPGLQTTNEDNVESEDSDSESDDITDAKSSQTDLYAPTSSKRPTRRKKLVRLNPIPTRKNKKWDMKDMPFYERRPRNSNRDFNCKYCSKKLCDYTGVYAHVSKFHNKEKDVEDYLKNLQSLQVVKCSMCDLTFPSRFHLHNHEDRVHLKVGEVTCPTCNKSYKNVQSCRNHVSAMHGEKGQTNVCHLCAAKFKWASTLKQHVEEIHEGKRDYQCKICDKKFYKKAHVNRHERIHGLDASKKILCPECGKAFWFNSNLDRHRKVMHQQGEEKFHCSYCGRGYCQKASMITHVQLFHFNMHAFVCKTCDVGFTRSKYLKRHMADVHRQLDFVVDETSKKLSKYHRTTDDLFYCSFCSDSFCYKTKLVEHMHHSHATSFPHACTECNQGFLEKDFLLYHQKMAHDAKIDDSNYENKIKRYERRLKDKTRKIVFETKKETKAIEASDTNIIENVSELPEGKSYIVVENVSENVPTMDSEKVDGAAVVSDSAAASLLVEVASDGVTYHYVIENAEERMTDGSHNPQDIANLIMEADQALQTAEQTIVETPTDGATEQAVEGVIPME